MKNDPTFWLLARSSGLTAYVLLASAMVAGLVLKSRPLGRALRAGSVTDVHRFLTLLALGALAVHGIAIALDQTLHMPLAGLVVPGASSYRPVAVAMGVLAAELTVVIVASFGLRRRIGTRNWRRLHWATYLVFAMVTAHGLLAGTDSAQPWARDLYLGAVGVVVFATGWRALAVPSRPSPATNPAQERNT